MVVGDFNLRGQMTYHGNFADHSVLTGATTKGAQEGRHKSSRLDRAYCRPGLPVSTELFTDGPGKELSDHHCLVVNMEHREQREITDYFGYLASAERKQDLRQLNLEQADAARVSVKDKGRDPKIQTAKRAKEREEVVRSQRSTMHSRARAAAAAAAGPADDA